MTADFSPDILPIKNFDAAKQIKLFQALKQNRFSGQLSFKNSHSIEWIFFLYLGRIIYATGGRHPVRRWRRNLVTHIPQIAKELQQELKIIDLPQKSKFWLSWDYSLLYLWVKERKIDLEQATANIRGLTSEILFDITQANTVSFQLEQQDKQAFQPLAMIDAEQQIISVEKLWHKWQSLSFQEMLPDFAPVVANTLALQESASEKTYQFLIKVLDSKHSIRDLAVQKQVDSLTFLRSISPYIHLGDIKLLEIPDIPYPITVTETVSSVSPTIKKDTDNQKLLIACVALSPMMNQIMAKVATVAGYEFVSESDSLAAIAFLLDCKPDMIFLDIELPGLSGYEICTQLRQLEFFGKVPIILFGRNIGLIERMKSKMSGASQLFQQSMDVKFILDLVNKYSQLIGSG